MLRLNIRQTFTQIGIRTQPSTLSTRYIKPEAHTEYVAPRSNKGTTQPKLDINSYPSRHSYGHSTNDDLTRAAGQRGLQDLQTAIKKHNHDGLAMANSGAKKGHDEIAAQAKQHLAQFAAKRRYLEARFIPNPEIHYTPSQVVGTPDEGKYDWTVQTQAKADVQYNPGKAETYIAQQGGVRQWTTEGKYDIYA